MEPTRRTILGASVGVLGLAGCLGDDAADGEEGDDGDASDGEDATDGEASDATLTVVDHADHGEILADADGAVVYMFDDDERGTGASTCYDGCAGNWPPLTVDGEPAPGDDVAADLTAFERDDGTTQVAANGWPLYYFAPDEGPGDATGQGVDDVWWVLDPTGTPVRPSGADGDAGGDGDGTGGDGEDGTADDGDGSDDETGAGGDDGGYGY